MTDTTIVRERAYALWEEAGRPTGEADRFWLNAERELAAILPSPAAQAKKAKAAKKAPAKIKAATAPDAAGTQPRRRAKAA